MIRINLLTEAKAAAAKKKTPILPTGARLNNLVFIAGLGLGVLYIAIMGLVLTSKRRQLDEDIGRARLEADRLKSIIEEVQGYEQKKANLQAKIDLINSLKLNQKGPVRLMDEISKALPDLVWLTSLEVSGGQIVMRGRTPLAQRRQHIPREPEEESLFQGARLQEPRSREWRAGHLCLGNDPHLHQSADAGGHGGQRAGRGAASAGSGQGAGEA